MYPYTTQYLAAERAKDLREQAAGGRRVTEARRARRGPRPVPASRGRVRLPGMPRWA